jgi:hypothetical protein
MRARVWTPERNGRELCTEGIHWEDVNTRGELLFETSPFKSSFSHPFFLHDQSDVKTSGGG